MHNFDKQFGRMQTTAIVMGIFSIMITISVLGFLGWVIYKVLVHFGIA